MAFLLPFFEYDVFVSYSHGVQSPGADAPLKEWTLDLINKLETDIRAVDIEFDNLHIWRDEQVDPTIQLSDEIRGKVKGSGILLVVMSPRYLASTWCKDELEWFKQQVQDRERDQGRVFIIRALRTDENRWPEFSPRHPRPRAARISVSRQAGFDAVSAGAAAAKIAKPMFANCGACKPRSPGGCGNCAPMPSAAPSRRRQGRRCRASAQRRIYLHARPENATAYDEVKHVLLQDGMAPLSTVADPGRDIADWMRESRARIETAKRCDALALVRADGDERFIGDLLEIGVDERERIQIRPRRAAALRGARPFGRGACRSTCRATVSSASMSAEEDWRGKFHGWLNKARERVGRGAVTAEFVGEFDFLTAARPKVPIPACAPSKSKNGRSSSAASSMIDEVIDRLAAHHLVMIHGSSGSGKSSLVRAGVLPKLARQHLRAGAPWQTCSIRPSGGPLWNLAKEFARLEGRGRRRRAHRPDYGTIQPARGDAVAPSPARSKTSRRGGCASWSTNSRSCFASRRKPAARRPSCSSTSWCAAAINRRQPAQIPAPPGDQGAAVHVVATMRSEFLGECARFNGLAEAVNQTQYLVPRMDRDGLLRAIRRPALLYGGEVSLDLAERLIADVGGREDELPLIQHGLMYMWNTAAATTPPGGKIVLDADAARGSRRALRACCRATPMRSSRRPRPIRSAATRSSGCSAR